MDRLLTLILLGVLLALNGHPMDGAIPISTVAKAAELKPGESPVVKVEATKPGESPVAKAEERKPGESRVPADQDQKLVTLPPRPPSEGLNAVKDTLQEHWKEVQERHGIKIMMAGVGKDHILMQIRRAGNWEVGLSDADLDAVKRTLFDIAGTEFPIQLTVWSCCTGEAGITGKITQFDQEQKRILIVNEQKKNGQSQDPEAYWVGLAEDGIFTVGGKPVSSGFDKTLIGREAKVWNTGMVLQSYPAQTTAIKVEVE